MVEYVVEALLQARGIGRVLVVRPAADCRCWRARGYLWWNQRRIIENIRWA